MIPPLEQGSTQYRVCDREIDHQAGNVHEGRYEGRGRARRIDFQVAKEERQHRTGKRSERHDSDQAESHGER